jgi:hypothetical protein
MLPDLKSGSIVLANRGMLIETFAGEPGGLADIPSQQSRGTDRLWPRS